MRIKYMNICREKELAKVTIKKEALEMTVTETELCWSACSVSFNCPNKRMCAFRGIPAGLICCNKYFFLWGSEKRHKQTILGTKDTDTEEYLYSI